MDSLVPSKRTDETKMFEDPGAFYLGRRIDVSRGAIPDDLVLYDAKDLTTHAVCVGQVLRIPPVA